MMVIVSIVILVESEFVINSVICSLLVGKKKNFFNVDNVSL